MLDEIDKLGRDFRGDPSSALLEVLDPAQNYSFTDHYLNMPFDLSNVLFICTANMLDTVPRPLLDRMEIIHLPGYTRLEKLEIAKRYLVPRQIEENGLNRKKIGFTEAALTHIITDYTAEAGVRTLERSIGSVCRKAARGFATGKRKRVNVSVKNISGPINIAQFAGASAERGISYFLSFLVYNLAGSLALIVELETSYTG